MSIDQLEGQVFEWNPILFNGTRHLELRRRELDLCKAIYHSTGKKSVWTQAKLHQELYTVPLFGTVPLMMKALTALVVSPPKV